MNNQNQLNGIDPKLAERFHAVMNTPTNASPNPSPTAPPAQTPTPTLQPLVVAAPSEPAPMPAPATIATPPSSEPTEANMAAAALPQMPGMQAQTQDQPQVQVQTPEPAPVVEQKVEIVSSDLPASPQPATNSQVFSGKKQRGKISPIIVVLGTAVFLVIYTIVWVKVFNLSLPFLP